MNTGEPWRMYVCVCLCYFCFAGVTCTKYWWERVCVLMMNLPGCSGLLGQPWYLTDTQAVPYAVSSCILTIQRGPSDPGVWLVYLYCWTLWSRCVTRLPVLLDPVIQVCDLSTCIVWPCDPGVWLVYLYCWTLWSRSVTRLPVLLDPVIQVCGSSTCIVGPCDPGVWLVYLYCWTLWSKCVTCLPVLFDPVIQVCDSSTCIVGPCDPGVWLVYLYCLTLWLVYLCRLVNFFSWLRGTVVERRSVTSELFLSYARPAADGWPFMWVNRPLQGQPTRPTQPFVPLRSINE